jgi:hypothetical protein
VLHVAAAPADVLDVVDRLDLARDPFAGVEALGRRRHERLFGLTWHPKPGAPGHVDVVWDIRVEADGEGGSYLSSTRRFTASDDEARNDFRSYWRYVRLGADAIARRTLRTIKRVAEEDSDATVSQAELLLAA